MLVSAECTAQEKPLQKTRSLIECRVLGFGFRVLELRIQILGVQGLGLRVWGLVVQGFRVARCLV